MKIPKYIYNMILRRAKLAENLLSVDLKLSKWLDKNDIPVEECDCYMGVEVYVNPWAAAKRVKDAIEQKQTEED